MIVRTAAYKLPCFRSNGSSLAHRIWGYGAFYDAVNTECIRLLYAAPCEGAFFFKVQMPPVRKEGETHEPILYFSSD